MLPLCRDAGHRRDPVEPARPRPADARLGRRPAPARRPTSSARRSTPTTADADRQVVEAVAQVAAARGVPRAQVALAWLLQKPGVTAPIVGATKLAHLDDAVAALSLKLDARRSRRSRRPTCRTPSPASAESRPDAQPIGTTHLVVEPAECRCRLCPAVGRAGWESGALNAPAGHARYLVRTTPKLLLFARRKTEATMAQATIGGQLLSRLRTALPDAAAATVAAALSWLAARALFGHPQPLFAAIAAIVCLAPGLPNHGRQAVGLVLGVATGIAVGEAALFVSDTFPALRLSLATFVAIMVASAYGLLPVVPIQSGVSALLVLALGPETAGTVRLLDVACGTAVGLLFSQVLFTPDPVKQLREGERALLDAIGTAFAEAERALAADDQPRAQAALKQFSDVHGHLVALAGGIDTARSSATWSLRGRLVRRDLRAVAGRFERRSAESMPPHFYSAPHSLRRCSAALARRLRRWLRASPSRYCSATSPARCPPRSRCRLSASPTTGAVASSASTRRCRRSAPSARRTSPIRCPRSTSMNVRASVDVELGTSAVGRQVGCKKSAYPAPSAAAPTRPIGMPARICRSMSGVSLPAVMAVAMNPGQIASTRIPSGASSRAVALSPTPPLLQLNRELPRIYPHPTGPIPN